MSGKAKKSMITDEMTLQDIFKSFYSKAKTVDVKNAGAVNSAMSSLNGFSAKLEAKRKAAREAKEAKKAAKGQGEKKAEDESQTHMNGEEQTKGDEKVEFTGSA